mgnify:CR=1 FL=1
MLFVGAIVQAVLAATDDFAGTNCNTNPMHTLTETLTRLTHHCLSNTSTTVLVGAK